MPFENDGVISWELMVERMNSDLANILGNLVNRTISMSNKYFGGVVENKGAAEAVDEDLKAVVLDEVKKVDAKMAQPVSYTHLDVYKRQASTWGIADKRASV